MQTKVHWVLLISRQMFNHFQEIRILSCGIFTWKDKYHNSFFLLVFVAEHAVSGCHFGQSGSGVLAVPIPFSCLCTSSWAEGTAWGREALTFCKCWSAMAKTWLRSQYRLHHGSSTLKKINSIPEKNKYNLLLSCCSESKFRWRFERSLFFFPYCFMFT